MKAKVVSFNEKFGSKIRDIRNRVFTKEQHIDSNLDFDGQDHAAVHALIICDGTYVGTGRMLPDGHIGRLAVLKEYRGKGFGASIVISLVEEAKNNDLKRVILGAQNHAVNFYKKLGFSTYGKSYWEANIEHVHMEKNI